LRVQVLEKVKSSIESELAPKLHAQGPLVSIGDNGNIVINESLVFEYNSYAIKPSGTALLRTLAQGLGNLLADAEVRENVDAVVIQGHTDERGSGAFNRELSAKRANAVLNFLFEANPQLEERYGSYFAASAYSKYRPLTEDKTEAAFEKNRRIEISVVLKDANVRRVIDDYVRTVDAGGNSPPSPSATP
jgi:chemotaxis protein MotB